MKGRKTEWTPAMLARLREAYPTAYNKEIAEEFNLGWRTIVRKARELSLEKEAGFLEKRRPEITSMAIKNRRPNPTKGLKGWSVPGGERYRYQKGNVPLIKNNPLIVQKVVRTRNETLRKEKLRLKYGLDQKTKLKLTNFY